MKFNGIDKGVIGRPMYSDSTLQAMTKKELIELLHLADRNHERTIESYKNAIAYAERLQRELDERQQEAR